MKYTKTQNVILESYANIELLVTFDYELVTQQEDFHGTQDTSYYEIELTDIELIIANQSVTINGKVNLLPFLTGKQETEIKSQLEIH